MVPPRFLKFLAFSVLFALPLFTWSQGFNELENLTNQPVYSSFESFSKTQKTKMLRESKKAFQGDNYLHPLPRILTREEKDFLVAGVQQRAKALTAFLKDYYSGEKTYEKAGIFPDGLVEAIIKSHRLENYFNYVDPSEISFLYGPDIIRDSKGVWRVIEDNPGFIGGLGDLELAQKQIFDWYKNELNPNKYFEAKKFYKKLADRYKARAKKFGSEKVVLLLSPPYSDNEDHRLRKLLAEYGIESITPYTKRELRVNHRGVFVYDKQNPQTRGERVGFVILHSEPYYFDGSHPGSFHQLVIKEALEYYYYYASTPQLKKDMKEYRKKLGELITQNQTYELYQYLKKLKIAGAIHSTMRDQIPGLFRAIFSKKVGANNTPGVDFIGDKQFYLYVEKLISFYLKEEPLIKNIKTQSFANLNGKLNDVLFQRVFKNFDDYVVKQVDGRGGSEVWVGAKTSPKDKAKVKKLVKASPDFFIVQAYTPLSEMDDLIVDLRMITDVHNNDVYVADTPWGRGLPKSGSGKVNLSGKGREVTVLTSKNAESICSKELNKLTR